MNTKNSNPKEIVRAQHRAAQAVPVLGVIAAGLAVTLALIWFAHPAFAPVTDWKNLRLGWLAGVTATVIGAAMLWRTRRRPLLQSAAEMDARLATHNRLETATALHEAQDALARAQRAETEQFLQHSHVGPRRRGMTTLGLLVTLLALAHLATLICWARPVQPDLTAKKDSAAEVAGIKKAEPALPSAYIEWHSPDSETAATAIEEVPLEAAADSTSGLRDAVLEVEVNGEHRLSQPLKDDLTQPGSHTLKPSLYLDQLDVKTYDIISYHISAQRIAPGELPPTTSPVQFVQVKPVREDTFICAGGDQPSKCFNYVTALKAAQLRLLKDNFTLAHAEVKHDNDEWRQENTRVGGAQGQLAGRTDEVIELMTTNHYPEPILVLVRDSQPLMVDAEGKIQQQENQPALAPQGKALGYLTEVEKYLKNSIKLAGSSTQPKAADPFQQPKNLELKTHPLTRAGKIDKLAAEQARLAGDLAAGNTNSTIKLAAEDATQDMEEISGTPGERQSGIKQHIEEFLNDPKFDPEALKHLQSSDQFAGQSQERINGHDFTAASEPAAEAARELHATAEALRAGDNQAAKNQLADALLKLSAAAGQVRQSAQAKTDAEASADLKKAEDAVNEAAKQMAAEAQRQQENGATNAAAGLSKMAKLLRGESLKQLQAQAQQSPRDAGRSEALASKLAELAEHAGRQRTPGPLSRQDLARLVNQFQRTQANLNHLASQCSSLGAAQSGKPGQSSGGPPTAGSADHTSPGIGQEMSRAEMQRAEAMELLDTLRLGSMEVRTGLSTTTELGKLDKVLSAAAAKTELDTDDIVPLVAQLEPPLTQLINTLQTQLAAMRRPYELTAKETAQALPAYRAAVADYFERVSRDYQPARDDAGIK